MKPRAKQVRSMTSLMPIPEHLLQPKQFKNDWRRERMSLPPANISREAANYEIELAVPGISKDQLQVEWRGGMLHISAQPTLDETRSYEHQEFDLQSFETAYALPPDADHINIRATCEHGILRISIPRNPMRESEPKAVPVG